MDDAPIIARHRHRMFVDAGRADTSALRCVRESFEAWVALMMRECKYMGWLAMKDGKAIAGAGLMKIRVVSLHAAEKSRRMYGSSRFRRTNEMFYVEPVEG